MNKIRKSILLAGLLSMSCFSAVEVFGYGVAVNHHIGAPLACAGCEKGAVYLASDIKEQSDYIDCTVSKESTSAEFDEEKIKFLISRKHGYALSKSVCKISGVYVLSGGQYKIIDMESDAWLNACIAEDKSQDTVHLSVYDVKDYAGKKLFLIVNIAHTGASGSVNEKVAVPFDK